MRSGPVRGDCRRRGARRSTRTRQLSASPRLRPPVGGEAEGLRGASGVEGGLRPRPPWCATAVGPRVQHFPSHLASPPPPQWLSGYPHLALLHDAPSLAARIRVATPAPARARRSAAFSATASTCRCGWGGPRVLDPLFWLLKPLSQTAPSPLPRFSVFPTLLNFIQCFLTCTELRERGMGGQFLVHTSCPHWSLH